MEIKEVIKQLEALAPLEYALDWDNCGLQVGNTNHKIKKIGIALSPTIEIVQEAINNGCNLLITHHPLLFKPIKSLNLTKPIGKMLELAIKADLAIYTMHTNFDSASSGLNYTIAKDLGLDNINILSVTKSLEMFKLVAFVPEEITLTMINALAELGVGNIGNFSHRSFISSGISTFCDADNQDIVEIPLKEAEDKLEMVVSKNNLEKAIKKLKEVHPYDDFIYEVYKLEDKSNKVGIGTIGEFYTPFKLSEVLQMVKRNLKLKNMTYIGDPEKEISKVAICTGSGGSFINLAKDKGANLYITGDIKYHNALDAKEIDLALIDAGHHGTEIIAVPFLHNYIKAKISAELEIVELIENDPFSYI